MDESTKERNLSAEIRIAFETAACWGVELDPPFESNVSYVAPTNDGAVLKVACTSDDEGLHEADALELWNGDGAVRLLRRSDRAVLEERAVPGIDLSGLPDEEATDIATGLAKRLWRPAVPPFRPVGPAVSRWLERAAEEGSELAPFGQELFAEIEGGADWVVHGDFHHYHILRSHEHFVAIDPKPYLADREYDVPPFLWNPMNNHLEDEEQTERRIAASVAIDLDETRIRAWTVIRGSYLRSGPEYSRGLKALIAYFVSPYLSMGNEYWPLFDLRITTSRLEIRLPSDDDLMDLARLAVRGVHDPAAMPFLNPWTDEPSPLLERGMLQWGWRHRAEWTPNNWTFNGAVIVEDEVVGVQSLTATDFSSRRVVKSGSWLGLEHQRNGIGKEMRTAILAFAFDSLDAKEAESGGFSDNESSLNVSRALGYEESGRRSVVRRGIPAELIDVTLTRSRWNEMTHVEVEVSGLEGCREFFIASN